MKVSVTRKEHFNAAHRLHVPDWSEEQNREFFGLCNNKNFHGHNYTLYVKVTGTVDPVSGYLVDLKWLSEIIKLEIKERFDHRNLNLDCEEFKNLNPTAENISMVIWKLLRKRLPEHLDLKITLYETERNSVEFSGE